MLHVLAEQRNGFVFSSSVRLEMKTSVFERSLNSPENTVAVPSRLFRLVSSMFGTRDRLLTDRDGVNGKKEDYTYCSEL